MMKRRALRRRYGQARSTGTAMSRLRREATSAAERRGHKLGNFIHSDWRPTTVATAECTHPGCKAFVTVNTKPAPNEIDIGGDAVAVHCPVP